MGATRRHILSMTNGMIDEQLGFVKLIAKRLKSAGVEYMLTGSMAMAAYGNPRMTRGGALQPGRTHMILRSLSAVLGACLTASILAPSVSVSAQQVALRWKYVEGSEIVYRLVNHQEITMPMMGGNVSEQTQTTRWRVIEVAPNGDATVTVTTDNLQVEMSGPTGNVSYDSRSDEVPVEPAAGMLVAMAGWSYTLVIDPLGTIKSVQGMDRLIEEMMAAMSPEARALGQGMLAGMFTEEFIIELMQNSVQIFPQDPVGPGDSWQHSFNAAIPMVGELTTNLTFTVDSIEERDGRVVAVISSTGEIVAAGMMEMGDTEITSSINFDVGRGITLSSTATRNVEMTITIGGQRMTIGTVGTTTIELIEYVPGG